MQKENKQCKMTKSNSVVLNRGQPSPEETSGNIQRQFWLSPRGSAIGNQGQDDAKHPTMHRQTSNKELSGLKGQQRQRLRKPWPILTRLGEFVRGGHNSQSQEIKDKQQLAREREAEEADVVGEHGVLGGFVAFLVEKIACMIALKQARALTTVAEIGNEGLKNGLETQGMVAHACNSSTLGG